jgi:3-oxoacid CoA-transferase subunit B
MEHTTRDGRPKILKRCALPLTGAGVVDTVVTELGVIGVTKGGLVLMEITSGVTVEQVQKVTEPRLQISPELKTISV